MKIIFEHTETWRTLIIEGEKLESFLKEVSEYYKLSVEEIKIQLSELAEDEVLELIDHACQIWIDKDEELQHSNT